MSSREVWHFEKVTIKDSEYAQKCGLKGDCYFWVSKGLIKIEQLDRKTSFQITVSHIRNWGASSKIFFLELGTRSPTGHGRLEMTHKDPNYLRLLVRDTTSSSKRNKLPTSSTEATCEYPSDVDEDSEDTNVQYPRRKRYDDNKNPDYDDDEEDEEEVEEEEEEEDKSSRAMSVASLASELNQKWYRNKTTESEESERKIPVGRTLDGRHVMAGEGNNVYSYPVKKQK